MESFILKTDDFSSIIKFLNRGQVKSLKLIFSVWKLTFLYRATIIVNLRTDISHQFEYEDNLKFKKQLQYSFIAILLFAFIGVFSILYALALLMNNQ